MAAIRTRYINLQASVRPRSKRASRSEGRRTNWVKQTHGIMLWRICEKIARIQSADTHVERERLIQAFATDKDTQEYILATTGQSIDALEARQNLVVAEMTSEVDRGLVAMYLETNDTGAPLSSHVTAAIRRHTVQSISATLREQLIGADEEDSETDEDSFDEETALAELKADQARELAIFDRNQKERRIALYDERNLDTIPSVVALHELYTQLDDRTRFEKVPGLSAANADELRRSLTERARKTQALSDFFSDPLRTEEVRQLLVKKSRWKTASLYGLGALIAVAGVLFYTAYSDYGKNQLLALKALMATKKETFLRYAAPSATGFPDIPSHDSALKSAAKWLVYTDTFGAVSLGSGRLDTSFVANNEMIVNFEAPVGEILQQRTGLLDAILATWSSEVDAMSDTRSLSDTVELSYNDLKARVFGGHDFTDTPSGTLKDKPVVGFFGGPTQAEIDRDYQTLGDLLPSVLATNNRTQITDHFKRIVKDARKLMPYLENAQLLALTDKHFTWSKEERAGALQQAERGLNSLISVVYPAWGLQRQLQTDASNIVREIALFSLPYVMTGVVTIAGINWMMQIFIDRTVKSVVTGFADSIMLFGSITLTIMTSTMSVYTLIAPSFTAGSLVWSVGESMPYIGSSMFAANRLLSHAKNAALAPNAANMRFVTVSASARIKDLAKLLKVDDDVLVAHLSRIADTPSRQTIKGPTISDI